jgi:hypothetical protein
MGSEINRSHMYTLGVDTLAPQAAINRAGGALHKPS